MIKAPCDFQEALNSGYNTTLYQLVKIRLVNIAFYDHLEYQNFSSHCPKRLAHKMEDLQ